MNIIHSDLDDSFAGYSIYNLYLESAHWNGSCIDEQFVNKSIESFPMVYLKVQEFR